MSRIIMFYPKTLWTPFQDLKDLLPRPPSAPAGVYIMQTIQTLIEGSSSVDTPFCFFQGRHPPGKKTTDSRERSDTLTRRT